MNSTETSRIVATVVEPRIRSQLDTASGGIFSAVHTGSVGEVLRAVRERPVHAVFVSPGCVGEDELSHLSTLVDGFPGIPTVALVSRHDPTSSERLLELGAHGIRKMVDLSESLGWKRLRNLVSHPNSPTAAKIFVKLIPALGNPTPDCRSLFEILVRLAPGTTTIKDLTERLRVHPSTFMSRFFRLGLPSPKRYLASIRIVYAAALLEEPGLSLADVAYRLQYSSPQSFGRHLRTVLGTTASEFRTRYPFDLALDEFLERLVVPFRTTFRTFHPLDQQGVGILGHTWWEQ
ncbi:MAG: helix-turn-helix transcriptional regulator [Myxococcota bacterium]|nr:helix-turn-helix transcriptional regulator [Myxococcota bacterium]